MCPLLGSRNRLLPLLRRRTHSSFPSQFFPFSLPHPIIMIVPIVLVFLCSFFFNFLFYDKNEHIFMRSVVSLERTLCLPYPSLWPLQPPPRSGFSQKRTHLACIPQAAPFLQSTPLILIEISILKYFSADKPFMATFPTFVHPQCSCQALFPDSKCSGYLLLYNKPSKLSGP